MNYTISVAELKKCKDASKENQITPSAFTNQKTVSLRIRDPNTPSPVEVHTHKYELVQSPLQAFIQQCNQSQRTMTTNWIPEVHPPGGEHHIRKKGKKNLRPPDQRTLHDTMGNKYTKPPSNLMETWGCAPSKINTTKVFRIQLQNPRGLKLFSDALNTHHSYPYAKQWG